MLNSKPTSLFFISVLFAINVCAENISPASKLVSPFSAIRYDGESAAAAYKRYVKRNGIAPYRVDPTAEATAVEAARPLSELNFSTLPRWKSLEFAVQTFAAIRDLRFIQDPEHQGFMRRSSWLFPDDGCFARAALAGQNIAKMHIERPMKVFIFGNLSVKTANSPSGSVGWWYHVVPIVLVGQLPLVLDPAIDPTHPLPLLDWIKTMTTDPSSVRLSLCNAQAYVPSSPCTTGQDDERAMGDQLRYLTSEWGRLVAMSRDPLKELGDNPPWKTFALRRR